MEICIFVARVVKIWEKLMNFLIPWFILNPYTALWPCATERSSFLSALRLKKKNKPAVLKKESARSETLRGMEKPGVQGVEVSKRKDQMWRLLLIAQVQVDIFQQISHCCDENFEILDKD